MEQRTDQKTSGLSASVVMYGGADETIRCIESLAVHTAGGLTLYLVDNASPDGALDTVMAHGVPHGTVVLARKQNRGYGAGHNAVLPMLNSRYHVVSNPDIEISSDVLNTMADWMDAHPGVAITAPKLCFPDGREQLLAKRRPALLPLVARQTRWGFLEKYERRYLMLDRDLSYPTDVQFISGSFFMIRTEVFRKMGGFDEKYFMYVEDADITQKALRHGRAVYLPQVSVTHAWHRDAHRKPKQFWWQCRSMLRYFGKWGFKLK
ncbi:glycosyltransferase family 2 protein [Ruminococcaceae bacterium OttesenSCG-928-D13]|nr:glycosyltransferase family 2 protein [Ruminococcaceae bacterium OttesenSCG-928-D13]